MSEHEHKPKVSEWGFNEEHNWIPTLYGCTECDDTFDKVPKEKEEVKHSHTEYVQGCFACKVPTLQLSAGDAAHADSNPRKKSDRELADYRAARRQGIQPAGTSAKQITEAIKASDNLGSAYNAETMAPAPVFTKTRVKAMNKMGL